MWGDREFPTHHRLSEAVPDHPVWLDRVDGHASLGNLKAMQLAGITRTTPNPAGGEILRDAQGNATGLFVDNASSLVERHIPGGRATAEELILRAQEKCLAVGLTGVHDAGIGRGEVESYRRLAADGRLKLRIYAMIGGGVGPDYFRQHRPTIGERFTLRATKLFADGAMGSRGAWLFEPYADRPTDEQGRPYRGLPVMQPAYLRRIAEAAPGKRLAGLHPRHRRPRHPGDARCLRSSFCVEHAQNPAPSDIPRFARLGVIPSMQPSHAISDMRWAEARVGPERVKTAYAWRQFLNAGCRIAGGSDFPVEDENPLIGLYVAVTRQDPQGQPAGGWLPQERMTREEALRSATLDAAYAAFEEQEKGSLEPGRFADFVVWSRDIVACSPRELLTARPLRVVIGGDSVRND